MVVAKSKSSPKKAAKGKSPATSSKVNLTPAEVEFIDHLHEEGAKPLGLELKRLVPSPTNPRKHFDETEIVALAESYRDTGMLAPLTVRPLDARGDRFEIVAGERRYRAALKAGLSFAPCLVRDLTDDQVLSLQMIENLRRVDLNAIEEAEGYERMCRPKEKGGLGISQSELARRMSCTPSHICNRIRLLELPEPWRGRVVSREIPPTHAREILKIVAWPAPLEWLDAAWRRHKYAQELPALEEWETIIHNAVTSETESLVRVEYVAAVNARVSVRLGKREIADHPELEVIEWVDWNGEKLRAVNVQLARRLLATKFNAEVRRLKSRRDKSASPSPAKSKAEARAKAAAEREKAARKLEDWHTNWLRWLCARRLSEQPRRDDPPVVKAMIVKLLLLIAADGELWNGPDPRELIRARVGKLKAVTCYEWLSAIEPEELPDFAVELVIACLCVLHGEGKDPEPCDVIARGDLRLIAADLGINPIDAWKKEKAGPFTATLFALMSVEQLAELADEWMLPTLDGCRDREQLIDGLLATSSPKPVPAVLSKLLAKPKKKKR